MVEGILSSITSLFPITDEQAMWRVQMQDDAQAFARLIERWERPLQNLCTRMIGDSHRSEDVVQEAFARVYARRKDYQPSGRFSTYLWRIALNLCYDELRRTRRRKESSLDDETASAFGALEELTSPEPGPNDLADQRERADNVRHALMVLPEAYRAVLVLRHYEDLKFREIAEVLEIPEGTVKSRMAEALTLIAELLRPTLGEESRRRINPNATRRRSGETRDEPREKSDRNILKSTMVPQQKECML